MISPGSSFKLYKASRCSFVRLLNLLEGISMSSGLSSKQLRYVSMMTFLYLGLNLSAAKDCPSFMKCYISRSFLLYSSNSVCNVARSISVAVGRNFKPLDSHEILEAERFPLERFITFLLIHLPYFLSKHCLFFTIVEIVLLNFSYFLSSVFSTLRRPDSS